MLLQGHKLCSKRRMSIWKLRLGLNPFTLLLAVLVGLVCVVSYFYMLSFLLGDASPDQGPGSDQDGRRRLLWGEQQCIGSCTVGVLRRAVCFVVRASPRAQSDNTSLPPHHTSSRATSVVANVARRIGERLSERGAPGRNTGIIPPCLQAGSPFASWNQQGVQAAHTHNIRKGASVVLRSQAGRWAGGTRINLVCGTSTPAREYRGEENVRRRGGEQERLSRVNGGFQAPRCEGL